MKLRYLAYPYADKLKAIHHEERINIHRAFAAVQGVEYFGGKISVAVPLHSNLREVDGIIETPSMEGTRPDRKAGFDTKASIPYNHTLFVKPRMPNDTLLEAGRIATLNYRLMQQYAQECLDEYKKNPDALKARLFYLALEAMHKTLTEREGKSLANNTATSK